MLKGQFRVLSIRQMNKNNKDFAFVDIASEDYKPIPAIFFGVLQGVEVGKQYAIEFELSSTQLAYVENGKARVRNIPSIQLLKIS